MRLCDDGMSVGDWGESSPRDSFLALARTHTRGHNRTLVICSEFPRLARLG